MLLSCYNCFKILKNPVECIKCNKNFCKEHIKDFKCCPCCKEAPFSCEVNPGIIKLLEKHENEMIKNNKENIACSKCSFIGNPWQFCVHFSENHKKILIETFGKKIEKPGQINFKMPQRNKNQKNQNFEIYYTLNEMKDYNKNNIKNLNNEMLNNKNNKNEKRINNSLNLQQQKLKNICKTQRKYDNFPHNILNKIENLNLHYCNKKNEKINCDCCLPDQICRLGNCLCVDCMKHNIILFGLKNGELFNKAGRVARSENEEYHCREIFDVKTKNKLGEYGLEKKQCSFIDRYYCNECKILNKYKKIYLKYVYNIK